MILVVDDDADVRAYLELALHAVGYGVQTAPTLPDTVGLAQLALVDLLLGDGQSGVAVVAQLAVKMPVLVMSGLPREAPEVGAALAAGALGLLSKPFTLAALREAVEGALPPAE